ncbi:response regulator [Aggregatilineales bacterium SYSU G02658]
MESSLPLVLVVDDNEMNRDMLGRRLQRQHCEVVMAENGASALEIAGTRPFDLVLLDIMMPGVSGYEVLERMKADPALKHIPIIMISAVDDIDSVVRCIEMGAEDYLFKPFNPVLLKARVSAVLSRRAGVRVTVDRTVLAASIKGLQETLTTLEETDLSERQRSVLGQAQQHVDALAELLAQGS